MKVKKAQAPHQNKPKKKLIFFFSRNFSKFTIFFPFFQIYMKDPESAEKKEKPNF